MVWALIWYTCVDTTLYNFIILLFKHLSLCLATAIHNLENYSYLLNLKPQIKKSWCLNGNFISNISALIGK